MAFQEEKLTEILEAMAKECSLTLAVLSAPKGSELSTKIILRPIMIKEKLQIQMSDHVGQKVFHHNISWIDFVQTVKERLLSGFKQAIFHTATADYHVLVNKEQQLKILKKRPTQTHVNVSHNRKKSYLLEEGVVVPFLVELGVMTYLGKVVAKKSDKFKQMNRFLEMIHDVIDHLPKDKKITIIDFGCGKAYLTFALYHYLHLMQGYEVCIIGLDLKPKFPKIWALC